MRGLAIAALVVGAAVFVRRRVQPAIEGTHANESSAPTPQRRRWDPTIVHGVGVAGSTAGAIASGAVTAPQSLMTGRM